MLRLAFRRHKPRSANRAGCWMSAPRPNATFVPAADMSGVGAQADTAGQQPRSAASRPCRSFVLRGRLPEIGPGLLTTRWRSRADCGPWVLVAAWPTGPGRASWQARLRLDRETVTLRPGRTGSRTVVGQGHRRPSIRLRRSRGCIGRTPACRCRSITRAGAAASARHRWRRR